MSLMNNLLPLESKGNGFFFEETMKVYLFDVKKKKSFLYVI